MPTGNPKSYKPETLEKMRQMLLEFYSARAIHYDLKPEISIGDVYKFKKLWGIKT